MAVRDAKSTDIPALKEIAARAYEPYVVRMGREPAPMRPDFRRHIENDTVFVVEDGAVVAYAILITSDARALLDNIAVDPVAQGTRRGSEILSYVEAYLLDCGFDAYELYTNAHMKENIAWYTRAGFVETGRREQDGFDRVFFQKELC